MVNQVKEESSRLCNHITIKSLSICILFNVYLNLFMAVLLKWPPSHCITAFGETSQYLQVYSLLSRIAAYLSLVKLKQ